MLQTQVFVSLLFSIRGKGNYLYAQDQVDRLVCNHAKRFKMNINLIGLPASTPCCLPQVDFHTAARTVPTDLSPNSSLFYPKPSRVSHFIQSKIQSSDDCLQVLQWPRPLL